MAKLSPQWWRWLIIVVLLISYGVWTLSLSGVTLEERLGLELLFKLRGARPAPKNVLVVAIRHETSTALGLPAKLHNWSRLTHAQVVHTLHRLGARLIVFDIFFGEERDRAGDEAFLAALQSAGNVLLPVRSEYRAVNWGGEAKAKHHSLSSPDQRFVRAALAVAPMTLPDTASWVRRFYVYHPKLRGQSTLPMLALSLLNADHRDEVFVGEKEALSHRDYFQLYNFYGPSRTIRTIDYETLLQCTVDHCDPALEHQVKGAVVFVGVSTLEQPDPHDRFYTVFKNQDSGQNISGVELSATAFANLQDQSWLRTLPWYGNLILTVTYGLLCFAVSRYCPPLRAALVVIALFVVVSLMVQYCFSHYNLWLFWFNGVLLQTVLVASLGGWFRSRELQRQKNTLQQTFGRYIPMGEIDQLMRSQRLSTTREISNSVCMVTDAQGYSRLSEQLSPVELSELMQTYYKAVIEPIRRGGGIISDVAGDGVIALWPNLDSKRVWSQLGPVIKNLLQSVEKFNANHPDRALPTRVGLHIGEIALGHFGAADHYEFRAMGDLVNSTSRVEGVNKQIGTRILISEDCLHEADESLRCVGRFKFVGKEVPLRLYTLMEQEAPELLRGYQHALQQFETGQWQQAVQQFSALHKRYPQDDPTAFFVRYLDAAHPCDELLPYWQQGIVYLSQK